MGKAVKLGPPPAIGDRFGRFTLEAHIGTGGMASVYRAVDPHGDRYALKVLNPARVAPEDVKRFEREYRALSRLDHPNIVRVYDSGVERGYPWIAMELVDGGDLESLIARWRAAPSPERFDVIHSLLTQLCRALQTVHDRKLIHRDIKPSNILLTRDGVPKLTDFGVVKAGADATTHVTQLTMAGRLVGTVAFMAPELITTDEEADARADLYSLGAVLYLMLCFRRPIEAKSVAGYLARHLTEVPVPAGQIDPDVPPLLERIAQRLLQKEPARRYASASAVLAALQGEAHPARPTLQGRERTLQGWSRKLAELREGVGGCVVLNGVDGAGKSHLLTVMLETATANSVRTCSAMDWERDPLFHLAGTLGLDPEASIGGTLARAVVGALGEGPVVLAIDDLDRAPRRSIDALSRALRGVIHDAGLPLLVVVTARSLDAIASLVTGAATGLPADLIPVGPVDEGAAISMVRDRGVLGATARILGSRLHHLHGGLPGPMLDQLRALLREGWLDGRSALEVQQDELPVPVSLQNRLLDRARDLAPRERSLLDLLAVLDRPAGPLILGRCTDDPDALRTLDVLVGRGWLRVDEEGGEERYRFREPIAARVLRAALDADTRRALHGRIADALQGRRRRSTNIELAHHLARAGREAEAYPIFVRAARRAARRGAPAAEILEICRQADPIRDRAERDLPREESLRARVTLKALEGRARLARRDGPGALDALKVALQAAREAGSESEGALLADLGRAYYYVDDRRRARHLLEKAVDALDPRDPGWSPAVRTLGAIHLHDGATEDAERCFLRALEAAPDDESAARAHRGLAHVCALQGCLDAAAHHLEEADERLALDGDVHLRASVLTRAIELAYLTGNFGGAVRRAEQLVALARRRELDARLPDAYSLLALALFAIGEREEAHDAASQARIFAEAQPGSLEAQLRTTRVLLDLGRTDEARSVLPDEEVLPPAGLDDPAALHAALRARLLAPGDPSKAHGLAIWSLQRPPPLLGFRAAVVALDAAKALLGAGAGATARKAAKRALKALQGRGADGLRLEVLVTLEHTGPDPRIREAIDQVARRIASRLRGPALARFRTRRDLQIDGS